MQGEVPREARDFDLTESFALAFERHATQYWIRVLFALLPYHPDYSVPLPGEYACYRHGWIKAHGVHDFAADWSGRPPVCDPEGEIDFGTIERLQFVDKTLICDGEWGNVRLRCDDVIIELDPTT